MDHDVRLSQLSRLKKERRSTATISFMLATWNMENQLQLFMLHCILAAPVSTSRLEMESFLLIGFRSSNEVYRPSFST